MQHILHIEETMLARDDNIFMAISEMTSTDETYFSITPHDVQMRTDDPTSRLVIEYGMSLD